MRTVERMSLLEVKISRIEQDIGYIRATAIRIEGSLSKMKDERR